MPRPHRWDSRVAKVYLAAPWTHRPDARAAAAVLERAGHTITERWWDCESLPATDADLGRYAQADMDGVLAADVLVLLNLAKSEGKAVEQGIALQRGIPIIAIGADRTNVFQHLPAYRWVNSLREAIEAIG
jgi:nucleoside 2-deoxyribosyltransferase